MSARIDRYFAVGQAGKARRAILQAKKQWGVAGHGLPQKAAGLVDLRRPVLPHQFTGIVPPPERIDSSWVGA